MVTVIIIFHILGFLVLDQRGDECPHLTGRDCLGGIPQHLSLRCGAGLLGAWAKPFSGLRQSRQEGDHEIRGVALQAREQTMGHRSDRSEESPLTRASELVAKIPVLRNNQVELLVDGNETFDSIFEGIDSAEGVHPGAVLHRQGRRARARAQNETRSPRPRREFASTSFTTRSAATICPRAISRSCATQGPRAFDFHTRKGPSNRFQINFRNHRKIVVVDGHTAWVGGHNVGDEYMGRDPEFGHWRDTHVRIAGPAVHGGAADLPRRLALGHRSIPEFDWAPHVPEGGGIDVLIFPTGPADRLETATLMFLNGINSAQKRLWIASPYFVPDESVMNALHLAALRGVDVRIIIPDKADHLLVWLAAFSYFEEAQATGIRFFRYMDGFLHQKVVLIDDEIGAVGTANFDNRSFRLNFEIMAVVGDQAFATEIEQMLLADMENSVEMQPGDLDKKSYWFKLGTRLARLTSPIQ